MNTMTLKNKTVKMLKITLGVFFFSSLICFGFAQEKKEEPQVTRTEKDVTGEVSWIGKNKISVTYGRDKENKTEYEILLPFDPKEIKIEHKNRLSDIQIVDTVKVSYV